jgi:hypothetical protein
MRRVLLALSLQEGWGNVGWASDWGANIFAPTSFLGGARDPPREHVVRTQFTAPDGSSVDKTWRVTTKWAAVHDLGALTEYAAGRLAEEEVPRSALQVLEVVLRSGVSGAQCVSWLHASVCYITQNTVLCAVRVLAACQCVLYHTEHSAVRSGCAYTCSLRLWTALWPVQRSFLPSPLRCMLAKMCPWTCRTARTPIPAHTHTHPYLHTNTHTHIYMPVTHTHTHTYST